MIIDYDHNQVQVPQEIVDFCDHFTYNAERDELRYLDCVYMNMGYYGGDPAQLEQMRQRILPIF
jgi:hypothetical protein